MSSFFSILSQIFGRGAGGSPRGKLQLPVDAVGRSGDTVAADAHDDAWVVGRNPESVAMTSAEERAKHKLLRMQEIGVTEFKWMHSGVELPCNGEDHSKLDGKKYQIAVYLKSGKPLPGSVKGCRCTFSAFIEGFE